MTIELTDDQKLVKRGRTAIASATVGIVLLAFALLIFGLITERVSDAQALATFAVLAVMLEAGAVSWALWLLLSTSDGQEASPTRRNEALITFVTSMRMAVVLFGLVGFVLVRDHLASALFPVFLAMVGATFVLDRVAGAMKRRYPSLPSDLPSWRRQEPVASWAGWYPDPDDRSVMRYWDGAGWTESVHDPAAPAH